MSYEVFHGDCLAVLTTLTDDSVDLVLTDPPYFSTEKEAMGDKDWPTAAAFLAWLDRVLAELARVLKANGSLYLFAAPDMAARVELSVAARFHVLNSIVWRKDGGWHKGSNKEGLRQFFPASERIIFAEHAGSDSLARGESQYEAKCDELRGFVFEPLRAYLDGERRRAGVDKEDCNVACGFSHSAGGMASRHYFSRSQWRLPTGEHYESMQLLFNARGGEYLRREYEYLRREYEDLRREYEDLRRPFNATPFAPYTDVWDFSTVAAYPGKHPCEKPAALFRHIVTTSTRPGDVVLDPFMGSGTAGVACLDTGRLFIGIERDRRFFTRARRRIATAQPRLIDDDLLFQGQEEIA